MTNNNNQQYPEWIELCERVKVEKDSICKNPTIHECCYEVNEASRENFKKEYGIDFGIGVCAVCKYDSEKYPTPSADIREALEELVFVQGQLSYYNGFSKKFDEIITHLVYQPYNGMERIHIEAPTRPQALYKMIDALLDTGVFDVGSVREVISGKD